MKLLRPLSVKVILIVLFSAITTMLVALSVQRYTIRKQSLGVLKNEMNAILIGADRVADTISGLGEDGAFDRERLMEDLEERGTENYAESIMIRTVPIVAAWKTIEEAAIQNDLEFRIITNEARNSEHLPKDDWERALLARVEEENKDELFFEDKEQQIVAYAKPIKLEKSCLACHGDPASSATGDGKDPLGFAMEGWSEGDSRGVFVLKADVEKVDVPVHEAMIQSTTVTIPITVLLLICAVFIVRGINKRLKLLIRHLETGAIELNSASNEVAQSSASLADGASQQAASIEETSAAMDEMSRNVERNAEVAKSTSEFAQQASGSASRGVESMIQMKERVKSANGAASEMNEAMRAIKESSSSISKIIKTIDDIAYQTNILSLNAAVEAARAGEAGAGFAVVADEVRTLANRAAQAAKDTAAIIEDSITRTEHGGKMNELVVSNLSDVVDRAEEVQMGLNQISSGVNKVDTTMKELESSVKEQGDGILQVGNAISQVSDITQASAAAAEEAASSSEVLNTQSTALKEVLGQLQEMVTGKPNMAHTHQESPYTSNEAVFALPEESTSRQKRLRKAS